MHYDYTLTRQNASSYSSHYWKTYERIEYIDRFLREGVYHCVPKLPNAQNQVYSLEVYEPATLALEDSSPADELTRRKFVEGVLYSNVQLRCAARGYPAPTITWYYVPRRLLPVRGADSGRVQYALTEEATTIGSGTPLLFSPLVEFAQLFITQLMESAERNGIWAQLLRLICALEAAYIRRQLYRESETNTIYRSDPIPLSKFSYCICSFSYVVSSVLYAD